MTTPVLSPLVQRALDAIRRPRTAERDRCMRNVARALGHSTVGDHHRVRSLCTVRHATGTYRGLEEFSERVMSVLMSRLEGGHLWVQLHEIIADGDRVVALVSGGGKTEFGVYENTYAFVHTVRDGLITTVDEYLDTAQVETKIFGKSILAR